MNQVRKYRWALADHFGIDPDLVDRPGLSWFSDPERSPGTAAGYVLGERFVIWCDPAVADRVAGYAPIDGSDLARLEHWQAFGSRAGAEVLGTGLMRVMARDSASVDPASAVVEVDGDDPGDIVRVRALLDACDPDEVDEADIGIDSLDPIIRCTESTPGGALTGFASALAFDMAPSWWDIGVLTHPDHRGQGLGAACVARLVADLVDRGDQPLYRHSVDNPGSAALAVRLGLVTAASVCVVRFARPDRG